MCYNGDLGLIPTVPCSVCWETSLGSSPSHQLCLLQTVRLWEKFSKFHSTLNNTLLNEACSVKVRGWLSGWCEHCGGGLLQYGGKNE